MSRASLLFATGALAAIPGSPLKVHWLFLILVAAAIIGDTVNYWIGHAVGPKIFGQKKIRFLKKEHLDRTHEFYEKHGGITIVLARFMPIIRTFAPFVAGIGRMSYWRFIAYNVGGGIAWVAIFVFGGYFFGNLPVVRRNFTVVIIAIIFISILPGVIEYCGKGGRQRQRKSNFPDLLRLSRSSLYPPLLSHYGHTKWFQRSREIAETIL